MPKEDILQTSEATDTDGKNDSTASIRLRSDVVEFINSEAGRLVLSRSDYLELAAKFFKDRAHCGYLAEHSFLITELVHGNTVLEQLSLSNRVLAEALVQLESASMTALIQSAKAEVASKRSR